MKTKIITKNYFNPISLTVLVILTGIVIGLFYVKVISQPMLIGLLILSVLFSSSIQIADQWEKAVVLRMGKYRGLKGPGIFFIIPILDRIMDYIDQRIRVTDFKAEQTLTKDTVPVNVIAVLYWTMWKNQRWKYRITTRLLNI
jgi:regulator of protease activity HflC (stomatin/prohibitin superfamily)